MPERRYDFKELEVNGEVVRGYQIKGKFVGICAVIADNHILYYNYFKSSRKLVC